MCTGENLRRVRTGERVQVSMGVCDSVHPSVCALLLVVSACISGSSPAV